MTREEAIKKVRWGLLGLAIDKDVRDAFETLIPELRESEDERIRKGLIEVVSDIAGGWPFEEHRITKKEALAYLERQKEQKPEERFKEAREKYQVEWSEEDENIRQSLILLVSNDKINGYTEFYKAQEITCDKVISFLKSLRPQYHGDVTMTEAYKMGLEAGKASSWRPSEEQMDALQSAINACESEWVYQDDELRSLLTDLEKLM